MPFYEFRYTRADGQDRTVTQLFKMSEMPAAVFVTDPEDGQRYRAARIMSLTAKMASNWEVKGTTSDLPDETSRSLAAHEVRPDAPNYVD